MNTDYFRATMRARCSTMETDTTNSKPTSHRGLWNEIAACEIVASQKLEARLSPIAHGLSLLFEAGSEAPTLIGSRHGELDLRVAALFMKRALTDLRSLWVLLATGYTAPAASIAATLYEHSLVIDVVAGSPTYSKGIAESPHGDVPWAAQELCKKYAKVLQDREKKNSANRSSILSLRGRMFMGLTWCCARSSIPQRALQSTKPAQLCNRTEHML